LAIHPGLTRFFDPLVRATTWGGPFPHADPARAAGFQGDINFEFTGDDGWTWHMRIRSKGVTFRRGGSMEPVGTVSMKPETFFKLLKGETSFATVGMTGRLRTRGDGHVGLTVAVMIAQFRKPMDEPGIRGVLSRLWKRRVHSAIEVS
jgi:hypothetical protein